MSSVVVRAELIRGVDELLDELLAAEVLAAGSPSARARALGGWVDRLDPARRRRLEAAVALLACPLPHPEADPAPDTPFLEGSHP